MCVAQGEIDCCERSLHHHRRHCHNCNSIAHDILALCVFLAMFLDDHQKQQPFTMPCKQYIHISNWKGRSDEVPKCRCISAGGVNPTPTYRYPRVHNTVPSCMGYVLVVIDRLGVVSSRDSKGPGMLFVGAGGYAGDQLGSTTGHLNLYFGEKSPVSDHPSR